MARWNLEAVLKKAREQEKKFGWLYAAWSYEHALRSTSGTVSFLAEKWQRLGFCYERAARQAENLEEFKELQALAGEAYEEAASLFGKGGNLKNQGKRALCNAFVEYIRSWLASTSSEKMKRLETCWTLGKKALNAFQNAGDELNAGKTCITLLSCLWEWMRAASTEEDKRTIVQDGLQLSDEAVSVLLKFGNTEELLQAYSLASLHNWYAANISDREEAREALAQRSLEYAEKAVALSKEVDDPYSTAQSRWAASLSTLFFTDKVESAVEYAQDMLRQGCRIHDNYIKGVASYLLTLTTTDLVLIEANPDLKKRQCEEITEYAEDAVRHLQLVEQDALIADTYMSYMDSYFTLAQDFAANPTEKLAFSKKTVEIGRKGLEHAVRSGSPESMFAVYHALSKALHLYSSLEPKKVQKIKLLQEALEYRNECIQITETTFPSHAWMLGVGKTYAAQIKAELSGLEADEDKKTALLTEAISDIENGVAHCEKWIAHRPETMLIAVVAGYEDWFGKLLEELQRLTEDENILRRANLVYGNAAKKFEKVELPSRVAESFWKIARNQDQLGENQEAARSFYKAFKEYQMTAQKMPPFSDFFMDYASYMRAWSEIEKAKFAHDKRRYVVAMKHYRRTAKLLEQTKVWSRLSSNFRAWALLERAEDLSRKERSEESVEAFNKATKLFHEAKNSLQSAIDQIENLEEKHLVKRLIEVSDIRGEYCFGRVAIEEAKILDRNGEHVASAKKYDSAAKIFQTIKDTGSEQTWRELQPITYLCRAWQKMLMAEAKSNSSLYGEAAELFEKVKEHTLDQPSSQLALAHSNFCKALEAGTKFEITRDVNVFSTAKKYLEVAASYYLKSGFHTAAEYSNGTQRLFDAYIFIETAKEETDPEKKARYYMMAEKVLQFSVESFTKAKHPEKTEQVQQILARIREEKELAAMLSDILHAPTIVSSTASFAMLSPKEEKAVGLESFERANIQTTLAPQSQQIKTGEGLKLDLHIVNVGKEAVLLDYVNEVIPLGFEIVTKPDYCHVEDSNVNLKRRRLDPLKTEEITLVLRSLNEGSFQVKPKITYFDEAGHQRLSEPEPITIEISEFFPNRISTGYEELDKLLIGGIPETYPVILTSPFCNERNLLIKRFLNTGVQKGEIVFYITVEPGQFKHLAENHQSNLYLFICNPQADKTIKDSPNIFKFKGVEKLTNINIALINALRELKDPQGIAKRACIEIVSDVLLQHQAVQTRRWLTELITDLRTRGFTTLAVMNPLMHPPQDLQAILGLFEGEIDLYEQKTKSGSQKFLKIKRMYNQKYLENELSLKKEKLDITIEVSEGAVLRRISTGYEELDKLLIGGIPETYPVILTSPFCDERNLLIKRFLREGVEKEGAIAFYVSTEVSEMEDLAEEFQSNFYLFVCNPRADIMIKDLPNVIKLRRGVMNLTEINIALARAFRELEGSSGGTRRICITIVSDVLLQHQAVTTKGWLTELITDLRTRGFTTLAVMNPLMHPPQDLQAILGLFEGEIDLYEQKTKSGSQKFLKIKRMYNQKYVESALPLKKEKL